MRIAREYVVTHLARKRTTSVIVQLVMVLQSIVGANAQTPVVPRLITLHSESAPGDLGMMPMPVITPAPSFGATAQCPQSIVVIAPWQPPIANVQSQRISQVLRRASQAMSQQRFYQDNRAAIPLLFSLMQQRVQSRQRVQARLSLVLQRLLAFGQQQLALSAHDASALSQATQAAAAAQFVNPQSLAVQQFVAQVTRAMTARDLIHAAQQAMQTTMTMGRDDPLAVATACWRLAGQIWPMGGQAQQGLAAVESALIARAEWHARWTEFSQANWWLVQAMHVRPAVGTAAILDAWQRMARWHQQCVTQLRDAFLDHLLVSGSAAELDELLDRLVDLVGPNHPLVWSMTRRRAQIAAYGLLIPGQVLTDPMRDGGSGPQLVVIPAGTFVMGSQRAAAPESERPAHVVEFARGFAIAIHEVTVAEFRRFIAATGFRPRATRRGHSLVFDEPSRSFVRRNHVDWQSDYQGWPAKPNDPVIHVSVRDAEAYANWLSDQTQRHYSLPSEAQFEYVLRAGRIGLYPWGDQAVPPPRIGNLTGQRDRSPLGQRWLNAFPRYGDGYWGVAPVASFMANPWGVYDMDGNVSEWVADCWHGSYRRAPRDGAAWFNPGCRQRLVRGGSWANAPLQSQASWRLSQESDATNARLGFRLVRHL